MVRALDEDGEKHRTCEISNPLYQSLLCSAERSDRADNGDDLASKLPTRAANAGYDAGWRKAPIRRVHHGVVDTASSPDKPPSNGLPEPYCI